MKRQLVFDLPTRLFHWMFAGLFLTAFVIAKTIDDDSGWFNYHSLAGLTLGFLVLLRIIWGIIGTQHARFTDFALNPKSSFTILKISFQGRKPAGVGIIPLPVGRLF